MRMKPPLSTRERAVVLISIVVTGIGGGAIAVQCFRLRGWVDSVTGFVALGGVIFGCGRPGDQANGSPIAAEAVRRIGELYAIEAQAKDKTEGERVALRRTYSQKRWPAVAR